MSRIEVSIMGQGYVLGSPDGEEDALRAAAGRVDKAMCSIRDAGKIKARDRIAVLTSLNLAFDLTKAEERLAQAPQVPAPSDTSGDIAQASGDDSERALRHLIARLDQALQQDGQLL